MRRVLAIPLLLAGLALVGCTAGPEDSQAAPVDPIDAAYAEHNKCLGEHGVKLREKSTGVWVVDKDAVDRKVMVDAEEKCKSLLPFELPVDQDALKRAQGVAECYRRNGYPDWPDPDPKTGEFPEGSDMNDSAVMRKCSPVAPEDNLGTAPVSG
ncbi:hypothetical protein OG259_17820 [Streptomyces sp. NBC_00250]|uniref:hypothetical protein n=1 Tax=Streptomyces sp. NBC_00250 TaxID=2903641 RepID=UPI002E2BC9BC|nr:hypothetical protein [Streptomyces sp. NBC_00250]